MSLSSLLLDVLLAVLRDLDIVDVVRIGMTCKALYRAVQDRHVWVHQLEKLRQEDPALRPATPPLPSLSAQQLKTFVIGRAKLRLRWNNNDNVNGFATSGVIGISGVRELMLLPGGKSALVIDNRRGVTLRRIGLENGQVSLPVVANVKYDQEITIGPGWSKLLTAMSPCPILMHRQAWNIMRLVKIDHHNDAMSLETTFPIPEGYGFLRVHGQGRVVGFLIQRPLEPPRAVIIHLDYPGVSVESAVLPTYAAERSGLTSDQWNICIPTESLVIIHNANDILASKIPNFSSLSLGSNLLSATPMWHWPGLDQVATWTRVLYMTSEALYDPPSAREFNLYCVVWGITVLAITVTVPIDTNGDFASKSTESPALKQKLTHINHYGRDSAGFSYQKGLHLDKAFRDNKVDIMVTPLNDLFFQGGRKALRMSVSYKELQCSLRTIEIDMDEATGRVVIWGWDKNACETKIFVGDLV